MALFEKFQRGGEAAAETGAERLSSVIRNLNHVLNTRRGFGAFLPDYGIRDLNEYTSREQIARAVMAEVKRNIAAFEPAVEGVEIVMEESGSPFTLSFRLDCRVREEARSLTVVFDTVARSVRVDSGQGRKGR